MIKNSYKDPELLASITAASTIIGLTQAQGLELQVVGIIVGGLILSASLIGRMIIRKTIADRTPAVDTSMIVDDIDDSTLELGMASTELETLEEVGESRE